MADSSEKPTLVCNICNFKVKYDFVAGDQKPGKSLIVLESTACMIQDPFSGNKNHIIVGSVCSECKKSVCVGQDCSLYYTRRFCLSCVRSNMSEFPTEIQIEVSKKTGSGVS